MSSMHSTARAFSTLATTETASPPFSARNSLICLTESPFFTKDAATKSTFCAMPNSKSSLSWSVRAGNPTSMPGTLRDLRWPRAPAFPVIEEDAGPGREMPVQLGEALVDEGGRALHLARGQRDAVAGLELDGLAAGQQPRPDLGAFRVEHDGHGKAHLLAHALHALDARGVLAVGSMAEVEAHDVDAQREQLAQHRLVVDGGPERCDDFRLLAHEAS